MLIEVSSGDQPIQPPANSSQSAPVHIYYNSALEVHYLHCYESRHIENRIEVFS